MRKICLFSLCLVVIFCLTSTPLTALALDSTITADSVFVDTQVRFKDSEDDQRLTACQYAVCGWLHRAL